MVIYVVTDGVYSEYHVEAVFTSREKAEEFRTYHGYDNVEEFEADPIEQRADARLLWRCEYSLKDGQYTYVRWDTAKAKEYCAYGLEVERYDVLRCWLLAHDEGQLREIWQEKVRSFRAGQTTAKRYNFSTREEETIMMVNGVLTCLE